MLQVVLIIIVVLVCGGVGSYYGYRRWGTGAGYGIAGLALVILALPYVCGGIRLPHPARQSPDVSDSIRQSLDQAGLKDVSVSQDRDKGIVSLDGHVAADADKSQAETIAKSIAAGAGCCQSDCCNSPGAAKALRGR